MDITSVFELGKAAIERIWPDPIKRSEEMRKLEEMRQTGDIAILNAHVQLMVKQIEVNMAEAQHKSVFVAGWRPAVGWVCVAILAYNYIGVNLLEWASSVFDWTTSIPPRQSMSELWPVLLGMLGIGGMRSFDKMRGTETSKVG